MHVFTINPEVVESIEGICMLGDDEYNFRTLQGPRERLPTVFWR